MKRNVCVVFRTAVRSNGGRSHEVLGVFANEAKAVKMVQEEYMLTSAPLSRSIDRSGRLVFEGSEVVCGVTINYSICEEKVV